MYVYYNRLWVNNGSSCGTHKHKQIGPLNSRMKSHDTHKNTPYALLLFSKLSQLSVCFYLTIFEFALKLNEMVTNLTYRRRFREYIHFKCVFHPYKSIWKQLHMPIREAGARSLIFFPFISSLNGPDCGYVLAS